MVTFKAEVYAHQRKKDGTFNIKIRVTHKAKKRYLATEWFCSKDDLTRSMKLKNQKYLDLTDQLIKLYRSRCDIAGERLSSMSVDEVVDLIQRERDAYWDLDFIQYARDHIKKLMDTDHVGNAKTYQVALNSLISFLGRDTMSIKEVTAGFLKAWIEYIQKQSSVTTGFAPHNYISRMRTVHSKAKDEYNDEEAGIIRIPNSPFKHIEIPKVPVAAKRAITLDQLRSLIQIPDKESPYPGVNRFNFSRDVFILSFLLIGMNEADMYEADPAAEDRITYQRKKTRNRRADKAEISIHLEPEMLELLEKYKDPAGKHLFCFYHWYSSVNTFSKAISVGLKSIGEIIGVPDLQFYSARHTWATLATNEAGVDKYTVHTALNHVDDTMRITDTYIKKSWKPIDEANRKVLDLVYNI